MNNEIIKQKSWWSHHWKWIVPVSGILLVLTVLFFTTGMNAIATDVAQAYTDAELYENALEKAKTNKQVTELLGELQPIDQLAILEGAVTYSNNNKTVQSSIRIKGTEGNAMLDISANRIKNEWKYTKLNVRIKNPPEKKQTITIATGH